MIGGGVPTRTNSIPGIGVGKMSGMYTATQTRKLSMARITVIGEAFGGCAWKLNLL
jgi:ribose 5-phosphate isomerase RpiB